MDRLTLGIMREPVARVLNVCTTDSSIPGYVNEAERRLVRKGKFVGTTARYRICTSAEGCLTWPRQIETIEGYQICNTPGLIRNQWYEFSPNGPGNLNGTDSWYNTFIDRGTLPTFDTITGLTSKVAVRSTVSESPSARILIKGYDDQANWIRTIDGGNWIDGEYVTISTVTAYTTNKFSQITGVIKPVTNGAVTLWQFDTATGTQVKSLAYYESDETIPIYRTSLLPGLALRHGSSGQGNGNCCPSGTTQVTVIAKLRHLDVAQDTDFLLLGNLAAIKLEVMSILKEERNLFEESQAYEAKAIAELNAELSSFEGDAAIPIIRQETPATWGASVLNSITLGWPIQW